MNRKIILVIVLCVIFTAVIITLIVMVQNKQQQISNIPPLTYISFFLIPKDEYNLSMINNHIKYHAFEGQLIESCLPGELFKLYKKNSSEFYNKTKFDNQTIINDKGCYISDILLDEKQQGILIGDFNELNFTKEKLNIIYTHGDNYYTSNIIYIPETINSIEVKRLLRNENGLVKSMSSIINKSIETIYLEPIEDNLSTQFWGNIGDNTSSIFKIYIESTKSLHSPIICFKWTIGITDIFSNYTEIEPPYSYGLWDKCFTINNTFYGPTKTLLEYNIITSQLYNDKLEISIIDRDYYYTDNKWAYVDYFENQNIGAKDFYYKIDVPYQYNSVN